MTETTLSPFFDAIKKGDRAAVEAQLKENHSLIEARDTSGLSPVLTALYYGQPAIADFLIARGAPLDLFEACASGQLTRVEACLNAEPSQVNTFAPDGFQPLGLAAFFGHAQVARLLLERGANPNTRSNNGLAVQPLNSAVAGQHLEVARLLLDYGADPNARQGEEFAPLHGAAQNGQIEMINLLLERGADPHATNTGGKLPLAMAEEAGHPEAAQILREKMQNVK